MIRTCIIDTSKTPSVVVNLVDYDAPVTGQPPGFDPQFIAVPSDTAQIGWTYDGQAFQDPTPVKVPTAGEQRAAVDRFRDARLSAGFADAVTGKTWQCDALSISKWDAIAASAGLNVLRGAPYNTTTYTLIAADNSTVTLAAPDASALLEQRLMAWVSATVLCARTMKNNILAGNPPADYTQGWP